MKIRYEDENKVEVRLIDLNLGELFREPDDSRVFMKADESDADGDRAAVCLDNGVIHYFDPNQDVVKVEGELLLKGRRP